MTKSFISLISIILFLFALFQLQQQYLLSKKFKSISLSAPEKSFFENNSSHYQLFYFGYTHCPDICPTALMNLGKALRSLEESSPQLQNLKIYFITLDPDRDSSELLQKYSAFFHPMIQGRQLSSVDLNLVTQFFGVKYTFSRQEGKPNAENYSVDHSSMMYLLNPEGLVELVIPHESTPEQIQNALLKSFKKKESI